MIRLTITCLASLLAAAPLLAQSRIAPAAANTPTEKVPWNAGVPYTYDGSGNVRQIDKDKFVYDKAGRLVQAQVNGVTRTYTYDAFGNRTGCTHEPGTTDVSDCQFGLSIDSETNRVEGVQYDSAGNVKSYYGHTYTYDPVNMTVRDQSGSGIAKEFVYTADDERLATLTSGSWTWTIRDVNGKVLREFASNAQGVFSWTRDYVYRDGLLLASVHRTSTGAATAHYHLDHLGTPRRVTDQNNRTVGFHDYYAFGPEVSGGLTEPAAAPMQYTGHERDKWGTTEGPETLDYMHARYYSPALGRFLSLDPMLGDQRDPQSWNRYAYTRNNPMSRTDPFGQEDKGPPCPEKRGGDKPCGVEPEPKKSSTATAETQQQSGDQEKEKGVPGEKLNFLKKEDWPQQWAAKTNSVPDNTILINSHGTPSTVNRLNAQQLAERIQKESAIWRPGTTIILNSCNAARGDNSIAEQLSRILKTTVIGYDQPVWSFGVDLGSWGNYGADGGMKTGGWPDFTHRGNRVTFVNGVKQEKKK